MNKIAIIICALLIGNAQAITTVEHKSDKCIDSETREIDLGDYSKPMRTLIALCIYVLLTIAVLIPACIVLLWFDLLSLRKVLFIPLRDKPLCSAQFQDVKNRTPTLGNRNIK